MLNYVLVGLLVVALVGIGALAMMIDSGIEDKHKTMFVYALFGLFGLIGVVFMMVEDKSAFVYGDWSGSGKKGGKKAKQYAEVSEDDDGGMAEAEATKKAGGSSGDDSEGAASKSASAGTDPEKKDGRDCDVCPPMVRMPGAKAVIGTLFREAGRGGPILGPLQEVQLPAYSIGRDEITVAQFEAFVKEKRHKPANSCRIGKEVRDGASFRSPGFEQGPDHPVVCVSWYDASAYADWLTQKTGRAYNVANEVEWEHAARAGSFDSYTTGKQIHAALAQFRAVGQTRNGTTNVGTFSANKYGLYDVHGNAAEMIRNCWDTSEAPATEIATSATPPSVTKGECSSRTVKGGSWASTAGHLHFAARAPIGIAEADNTVGFRVVRHRE